MKRKGKIPGRYHKTLKEQVRENPRLAAVYVILRVLVVLALVAQVFNGNFENVFLCVLTLILFTIPSFIERTIRIDIPDTLEIIILLFIFAAEILGEIQAYYVQFPYWDTMLHTLNGFLCAAIGFSLLDILNRDERLAFKLSPVYLAVVAFCFSMTIGVLWAAFIGGSKVSAYLIVPCHYLHRLRDAGPRRRQHPGGHPRHHRRDCGHG